jgi:SAM-dependent methyltransferase
MIVLANDGSEGGLTTWAEGDYPLMAKHLESASIAAVGLAAVKPTDCVVDVATGTGNAALIAAKLGAEVVGVDVEPSLLVVAEQRSRDLQLKVRWETADATALPIKDGWADVILSVFGIMYAGDHDAATGELARCASSDARIVLASWVPGSFMSAMGGVLSSFLPPPPPGSGPPSRWGDSEALEELVAAHRLSVTSHSIERVELTFDDIGDVVDFLVRTAGHVMAEQERLTDEGRWRDLRAGVGDLVGQRGHMIQGKVSVDLAYLLALIQPSS